MAFSIQSFIGGFSGAGSQLLDEKRASDAKAKVTTEQRQWQIATEARQSARDKKAKRDADQDSLDDLVEEASFYFDPEDMIKVSKLGKRALTGAIEKAKKLETFGITGKDLFKLPSINGPDDLPNPNDVENIKTISSSSFVKTPDNKKFDGSFDNYLVFAAESRRLAKTPEKKAYWDGQMLEIANMSVPDKDGAFKPNAISVATKGVDDTVDSYFSDLGRVEVDPITKNIKRMQDQTPNGWALTDAAYTSLENNPAYKEDSVIKEVIGGKRKSLNAQITGYAVDAKRAYDVYQNNLATVNSLPSGNEKTQAQDAADASEVYAKNFIPIDPTKPMTMKDIQNGAHRNYPVNTTIQIQDESGKYSFVIVTSSGVLKIDGFD